MKIIPQILGGGQQSGMRSGTDNVPGIAGLGVAAGQIYRNLDENVEHMYQLKEHIAKAFLKSKISVSTECHFVKVHRRS